MQTWRLCKAFGGTPSQWDSEPAVICDWLLAVDDEANSVANEKRSG